MGHSGKDDTDQKPLRWPIWVAGVATFAWCSAIGWYMEIKWSYFFVMEPNAVGDFLAGAFAPPAFMWLILGYFLQSRELHLSLQELRNSVKNGTDLIESAARSEARAIEAQEPSFRIQMIKFNSPQGGRQGRAVISQTQGPLVSEGKLSGIDGLQFAEKQNISFGIEGERVNVDIVTATEGTFQFAFNHPHGGFAIHKFQWVDTNETRSICLSRRSH